MLQKNFEGGSMYKLYGSLYMSSNDWFVLRKGHKNVLQRIINATAIESRKFLYYNVLNNIVTQQCNCFTTNSSKLTSSYKIHVWSKMTNESIRAGGPSGCQCPHLQTTKILWMNDAVCMMLSLLSLHIDPVNPCERSWDRHLNHDGTRILSDAPRDRYWRLWSTF